MILMCYVPARSIQISRDHRVTNKCTKTLKFYVPKDIYICNVVIIKKSILNYLDAISTI